MSGPTNDFLAPPHSGRRVGLVALIAVVVLAALVVVFLVGRSSGRSSAEVAQAPVNTDGRVASATASPEAGTGPLKLVTGSRAVSGVHVGYPHSAVGAVSAAVEYMAAYGSTLNASRAEAIATLVFDPSITNPKQKAAEMVDNALKSFGVSVAGTVPTGYAVDTAPVQYQLGSTSSDRIVVVLLADYTETIAGQISEKIGVFPLVMHWADGDWKLDEFDTSRDWSELSATPGTTVATADGWLSFQY